MDPQHIREYLRRFTRLAPTEKYQKEACQKIISQIYDISVSPANVRVNNNIVFLSLPATYKTEIFLNKQQLITAINRELDQQQKTQIIDIQ